MLVTAAVLRWLHARGLVTFDEDGATGDAFQADMPPDPDEAVGVFLSGGNAVDGPLTLGYAEPVVQVRVRGVPFDPTGPEQRAWAILRALWGVTAETFDPGGDAQLRVLRVTAQQTAPVPLGRDNRDRHEYTVNVELHVRFPLPTE